MTYTDGKHRVARLVAYVAYTNDRRLTVIQGEEADVRALAHEILTNRPGTVRVVDETDNLTGVARVVIDHSGEETQ